MSCQKAGKPRGCTSTLGAQGGAGPSEAGLDYALGSHGQLSEGVEDGQCPPPEGGGLRPYRWG